MSANNDTNTSVALHHPATMGLFRQGVVACLPTILGYWSIGFAAGAIGALAGFSIFDITLLAAFRYAGSAQFMFYSLYAADAGVLSLVLGVLLINMRYMLMSSYMAMYFTRANAFEKFIGGALLTDETFGVAAQYASRNGTFPFAWLFGLNLTAWLNWIVANLIGASLAASLPASLTDGLSFSLVSMFIGLLLMIWFASKRRMLETLTIAVSIATVAIASRQIDINVALLLATVLAATIATILLYWTKRKEEGR